MHDKLPRKIADALKPYQKEAIARGLEHEGKIYIADEMGLGKTLEALCISYAFKNDWPLLIITPASVAYQWKDQILNWFYPSLQKDNILVWDGERRRNFIPTKQNIFICSYDSVSSLPNIEFPSVICDECHYLKNYKTKRLTLIYNKLSKVK